MTETRLKVSRLKRTDPNDPPQQSRPGDDDYEEPTEYEKSFEAIAALHNAKEKLNDVRVRFRIPDTPSQTLTRLDMHKLAGAVAAVNRMWDAVKKAYVESFDDEVSD
ncbi:MAG TPA: hypothetical protein VN326_10065 [Casimicrobiaceae bacterium]|jgi:hypothetical protein|nr:hypothetical protein [Casimicrobiaceae bacterium]